MNHVKTYPGEETSVAQNQAAAGPDCVILADLSSGNGSWAVVHLACSHLDTVLKAPHWKTNKRPSCF